MPISCHFRDCKALLVTSLTHVSHAITSVQTFTSTFTFLTHTPDPIWPTRRGTGPNWPTYGSKERGYDLGGFCQGGLGGHRLRKPIWAPTNIIFCVGKDTRRLAFQRTNIGTWAAHGGEGIFTYWSEGYNTPLFKLLQQDTAQNRLK